MVCLTAQEMRLLPGLTPLMPAVTGKSVPAAEALIEADAVLERNRTARWEILDSGTRARTYPSGSLTRTSWHQCQTNHRSAPMQSPSWGQMMIEKDKIHEDVVEKLTIWTNSGFVLIPNRRVIPYGHCLPPIFPIGGSNKSRGMRKKLFQAFNKGF